MRSKFEILTGRAKNHLLPYQNHLIDEHTLSSFKALRTRLELYEIDLQIVSAFRDFERQELIWNAKAHGKRKLYDTEGNLLDFNKLSENEVLESILTWSAIPGASRHHWGTDIDIYDHNIKDKANVELTNEEYEKDFENLTINLNKILDENSNFFRPYSKYNGGVAKELWHISDRLKSESYFSDYTIEIFEENISKADIKFKEILLKDLDHYYKTYFKNINL